ncbi:kinase-like protein, partial [Dendrothele bispora CBS 962.96]
DILKTLNHPHIVQFYGHFVDAEGLYSLYMEFCEGGDLSEVIKQFYERSERIDEITIWNYFEQITDALSYCHGTGIIHRDIKPENVFLNGYNKVKLGDFGLSKGPGKHQLTMAFAGTPQYMSPERLQGNQYDERSDIWSLGCLTYELCTLRQPFEGPKTMNQLRNMIINGQFAPISNGCSLSLKTIINQMLCKDVSGVSNNINIS